MSFGSPSVLLVGSTLAAQFFLPGFSPSAIMPTFFFYYRYNCYLMDYSLNIFQNRILLLFIDYSLGIFQKKSIYLSEIAQHDNFDAQYHGNLVQRKLNVSIFLDLKKAFDTVDHDILLSKLSAFGICGETHCWIKAYLKIESNSAMLRSKNHLRIKSIVAFLRGRTWGPYYSLYT